MRTIERTTICVVLTIAPFVGIGCMLNRSGPPQLTRKEPKIFAVQREKPLSAQADTNKKTSPADPSEETAAPTAGSQVATDDRTLTRSTKEKGKPSSARTVAKIEKPESDRAGAAASTEAKGESKKTSAPSMANEVSSASNAIVADDSNVTPAQFSEEPDSKPQASQIKPADHEDSEEIEFEIPKPVSSPGINPEVPKRAWDAPDEDEIEESLESSASTRADEWNSIDGFDVNVEKIEERDFQQVCLVKFREERVFAPGLSEFTVEYHARHYRFSSAEAAEKFQTAPEQYVPTAGGLDIVAFGNNQEIVHGSLDFAVWYNNRLFLFSNHENIATFQGQPEKFTAIK